MEDQQIVPDNVKPPTAKKPMETIDMAVDEMDEEEAAHRER